MPLVAVNQLTPPQWLADARKLRESVLNWLNTTVAEKINQEAQRAPMGELDFELHIDMPKDISKPDKANEAEQTFIENHLTEAFEGLGYGWKFEKAKNRHLPAHEYPWTLYLEWSIEL